MAKKKRLFGLTALGSALLVAAFSVALLLGLELLCNILTALGAAFGAATLVYAHALTVKKQAAAWMLPLFAMACVSWFCADTLWLILTLRGSTPEGNALILFFYTLTNLFLGAAVLLFLFTQFRKWRSVQLLLDTVAIVFSGALLAWVMFFHKDALWLPLLLQEGLSSAISITLDFMLLAVLLVTVYSLRSHHFPAYLLLFSVSIAAYSLTDLYYYYCQANGLYIPNTLPDALYLASLLVLALAGLWKALFGPEALAVLKSKEESGRNWLLLFLYPAAALLSEGFVFKDTLHFLIIILIYKILSSQVGINMAKGELYRREKELTTTLERRVQEQYGELVHLANHDTITSLHNRRFFLKALEDAIQASSPDETLAVFLMDLDRFKTINDTLGHDVGDKVLLEISIRLQACCDEHTVLARLGGDEYALFTGGKFTRDQVAEKAIAILQACSEPILVSDSRLHVTMSVGIAFCPRDGTDRVTLLRNADIAMYHAKSLGYNRYVFYDRYFTERLGKKSEIELLLRRANLERDFELFYQPQIELATGRLIGAEALLRWNNLERGYISPKEFIPVAEEIDYIIRIGKWVMNEAVRQAVRWNTAYSLELRMGINISPRQLEEPDFLNALKGLLDSENFKSAWFDAEITESILLDDNNRTSAVFESLRELGVSVSIDDFGSGYSSLGYLNKYPFDRIKIDQTLIAQLSEANNSGTQVVKAIIAMAEALGVAVIAEGVETEEQLTILKDLRCPQVQGYYFGRPVPAADFERVFIQERKK